MSDGGPPILKATQGGGSTCQNPALDWLSKTDQCQAAGNDHADDERLEVVVFDQDVGETANLPEHLADERVVEQTEQRRTLGGAAPGTALVRIFDEHHVHLPSESSFNAPVTTTIDHRSTAIRRPTSRP